MRTSLSREAILEILRHELPYLRQRYGVERVALYGSFAKGTATDKSDVDLLVALSRPLGFEFVALADYLEKVLGRKVHLTTFTTLERSLRDPRYQSLALDIQGSLTDVQPETR